MTECDRIRAEAPGLAALDRDDPERIAATAHASGCVGCARALREAERLHSLLAAYEPPPIPAGALRRASDAIHDQLRRESRRRTSASVAGVCVSVLVLVGFARSPSRSLSDWTLAAVLWASAVLFAAIASRRPRVATVGAVLTLVAVATISGGPGPLAPLLGIECVATEIGSAAIVLGAVWLALRGGSSVPAPSGMAAAAAAGALAGAAALQVTCAAHSALPHLLAFHLGGMLIAAAGASLLWRRPERVAAR